MCVICKSVLMIAEFYKVLLTLYYISHLSCQRQLTTKWKLGLSVDKCIQITVKNVDTRNAVILYFRSVYFPLYEIKS